MASKISPVEIFKDTIPLMKRKWGLLLGSSVMLFIMDFLMQLVLGPKLFSPALLMGYLGMFLVGMATYVVLFHHLIRTVRGESPGYLPEQFFARYFKMIGKILLFFVAIFLPALVLALCMTLGSTLLTLMGVAGNDSALLKDISTYVLASIMYLFTMRWWFLLPAVAVNEESSLRSSWRMTRGHTWRLCFFNLPFLACDFWGMVLVKEQFQQGAFPFFTLDMAVFFLVSLIVGWFTYAGFNVWYVRLKERYETIVAKKETKGVNKIKARDVIKEGFAVAMAGKWRFAGLLLIFFIPVALLTASPALPSPWGFIWGISVFLGFILFDLFVVTLFNHLAVTLAQGKGKVMPARTWVSMGAVLVRGLLLWLIQVGVIVVPILLLLWMPFVSSADDLKFTVVKGFVTAIVIIGYIIIEYSLLFRLGMMIPAASVGHVLPVKQAWRMSKGYTWKMFLSYLVMILPMIPCVIAIQALDQKSSSAKILGIIILFIIDCALMIYGYVVNAVWYVRLKERFDAKESEEKCAATEATEPTPEDDFVLEPADETA